LFLSLRKHRYITNPRQRAGYSLVSHCLKPFALVIFLKDQWPVGLKSFASWQNKGGQVQHSKNGCSDKTFS